MFAKSKRTQGVPFAFHLIGIFESNASSNLRGFSVETAWHASSVTTKRKEKKKKQGTQIGKGRLLLAVKATVQSPANRKTNCGPTLRENTHLSPGVVGFVFLGFFFSLSYMCCHLKYGLFVCVS